MPLKEGTLIVERAIALTQPWARTPALQVFRGRPESCIARRWAGHFEWPTAPRRGKKFEIQAMNTFILAIRRFVADVVRGVGRASEAEGKLTHGRWR